MSIRKNKLISDDLEEVKSFFSIPRFQLVSTLDLSRCWRLKTVRLIYLLHYSLKSNMRELQLRQLDMSGIPRDLLGEAVSRSRLASLSMCENLRPTRITAVFTHTSRSKTLEELDFERVDLSSVPAPLLVGTVVRLRKVNLSSTSLTAPQASALLTGVLSSSSLEDLDLAGVDLRHMPPDLLAHAVSRLRRVCLWHTYLTTQQITAILKRCRLSTSLDFLDLSTNNISSVPPKLLAKSLTRIRSVKLMGIGQMTTAQISAILKHIANNSTVMEDLDLMLVDLAKVPASLLAAAVARLRTVGLWMTNLVEKQLTRVLKSSLTSASLRTLHLYWDIPAVSEELLEKARMKINIKGLKPDYLKNLK